MYCVKWSIKIFYKKKTENVSRLYVGIKETKNIKKAFLPKDNFGNFESFWY